MKDDDNIIRNQEKETSHANNLSISPITDILRNMSGQKLQILNPFGYSLGLVKELICIFKI